MDDVRQAGITRAFGNGIEVGEDKKRDRYVLPGIVSVFHYCNIFCDIVFPRLMMPSGGVSALWQSMWPN